MLALIYLAVAIYLGDRVCRSFYRFVSVPHRWAAAVLVGLLLSSWFTYLAGLAFAHTSKPLLWANLVFFATAAGAIFWLSRRPAEVRVIDSRAPGSSTWDWITLGALLVVVCCLLIGTLYVNKEDRLRISGMDFSDFAPQSAIAQSFALGHNFPTEYPHYAGEPNHYHFLCYFQAGNLEFLGLNLAWSVDILSVLGLISMLALVMALGELLFNSRVAGRLGAALFFFHGSPAFIQFLESQTSIQGAFQAILHLRNFLPSGYPYRGETWGFWTQIVFVNQRHLPFAVGIFLLVLIFLVDQYRQRNSAGGATCDANIAFRESKTPSNWGEPKAAFASRLVTSARAALIPAKSFIFSGFLLGALPLWNAPVFMAAAAVLSFLFVLFPCRWQMVQLGVTTAVVALPQLLYLRSGELAPRQYSFFHWGYIVDNPTIIKVINYIAFTFGLKWPVIILALLLVSWFQRRFFIAVCSLFLLTFCMQLSTETLASHKFLNIWLVMANLFAAYGLWWLWKLKTAPILGPVVAITLTVSIVAGGIIDLFPIYNSSRAELDYKKDPLVNWIVSNTKPDAVFLSDIFVNHQILLAGRKIFFGWPYFTWSAGYDLAKREPIYRQMFESKNPRRVFDLLKQNGISYVAFDDGVRSHSEKIRKPNEQLYARNFEKVYEDKQNRYGRLVIYKVPDSLPAGLEGLDLSEPPVTAFEGGRGTGKGQFDGPRGIAIDSAGNIFVADTNNGRIEKFSPSGVFITSMGTKGRGHGQFGDPNGLAIDRAGNIYVAEASNHRVQKLAPNWTFISEWAPGFYGPRRIAIGPDDSIYVVDQGGTRIVKFSPDGRVLATWGSSGNGDGQFNDHTSVAVNPTTNKVYVADPRNSRIQVFDSNGKFLTKWSIPEWGRPYGFEDLAIDSKRGRLYASSANMNIVLVFDLDGTRIGSLTPRLPDKLDGPSGLALLNDRLYILNASSARVSVIDLQSK